MADNPLQRQQENPTTLYALLAETSCTVADLIGFAKGLPGGWVQPVARALTSALWAGTGGEREAAVRRRQLVILTTLLARLTFDLEGVPQDPDAEI